MQKPRKLRTGVVTPDGDAIKDLLRKRVWYNKELIEAVSKDWLNPVTKRMMAGFQKSAVNKALAGEQVSINCLLCIATALEVPYESLNKDHVPRAGTTDTERIKEIGHSQELIAPILNERVPVLDMLASEILPTDLDGNTSDRDLVRITLDIDEKDFTEIERTRVLELLMSLVPKGGRMEIKKVRPINSIEVTIEMDRDVIPALIRGVSALIGTEGFPIIAIETKQNVLKLSPERTIDRTRKLRVQAAYEVEVENPVPPDEPSEEDQKGDDA